MIRAFPTVLKRLSSILFPLSLFGFLSLTGCHTLSPPKNLPHTPQEAALISPDYCLTMKDGARIPLRLYSSTDSPIPHAVILALHGFGDSRDAWETLAPTITSQHMLIVAPDLRGFGQAPPQPASPTQQVHDVLEELDWAHHKWPHTPIYLMGESMGGAIALLVASQPQPAPTDTIPFIQGTILLAPAVMDIGQPWRAILSTWSFFSPHMTLDGRAVPGRPRIATHNIKALRRLYFDPLTRHNSTVEALDALVTVMQRASTQIHNVKTPMLVMTGTNDQFVPVSKTELLFKKLPPHVRRDVIAGGYHLLSRNQDEVPPDIISWILTPTKFLPSGGDIRAIEWAETAQ
ncbi:alpha/beta fold hydrolase [Saccharibacter sp. 17.LH.SD]|uniref:alpha/beta hydrolase n=1 Tax=Saccharibacter sp. 17.LH.SD TaxID=2689393 RepID=UPI00136AF609|nr:alpha/beta fold hydrolase [Saccharibacter sp. 17.LH.SD]MXV44011.1 alpha/beta fold hydrolase [Saccharibacter sp. 17.LH.SD]